MSDAQQLVRAMTADDLPWVVEVTRQRRESLVPHAPRFWRPAEHATERHQEFLASLVQDSGVLSVRTQNGYLVAISRGPPSNTGGTEISNPPTWSWAPQPPGRTSPSTVRKVDSFRHLRSMTLMARSCW